MAELVQLLITDKHRQSTDEHGHEQIENISVWQFPVFVRAVPVFVRDGQLMKS